MILRKIFVYFADHAVTFFVVLYGVELGWQNAIQTLTAVSN